MSLVIVATHFKMAEGIKETAEYITGEQKNLFAIPAYTEGFENVQESIQAIIEDHPNETAYILTDILGGSVNTEALQIAAAYEKIQVICGVNLPLVIQLLMQFDEITPDRLDHIIDESQKGIHPIPIQRSQETTNNTENFDEF